MSWRTKKIRAISEKRSLAGKLGVKARAERREAQAVDATYCGTIRCHGPMFGGRVVQVRVVSDGLHVWADGLRRRNLVTFRRAMNDKLWTRARQHARKT